MGELKRKFIATLHQVQNKRVDLELIAGDSVVVARYLEDETHLWQKLIRERKINMN